MDRSHSRSLSFWKKFVDESPEFRGYNYWLEATGRLPTPTTEQKAAQLANWVTWLDDGKHPARRHLQGLRAKFAEAAKPVDQFESDVVKRALKGVESQESNRAKSFKRESTAKDPATADLVAQMRVLTETNGPPSSWHKKIWIRFFQYIAGALAFQFGLRVSEVAHVPPRIDASRLRETNGDENALRPEDVLFVLDDLETLWAYEMHNHVDVSVNDVNYIKIYLRSAKNIRDGKTEIVYLKTGLTDALDRLIGDVLIFCQWSFWFIGDIFFSMRYPLGQGPLKRLVPSGLQELIRAAAFTLHLDPQRFSTKSLKIGCLTTLSHAGCTQMEISAHGRHASLKSSRAYQRTQLPQREHGSGPFGLDDALLLTAATVQEAGIGRAPPRGAGRR